MTMQYFQKQQKPSVTKLCNTMLTSISCLLLKTRIYSSRMCTAHLLTDVSWCILLGVNTSSRRDASFCNPDGCTSLDSSLGCNPDGCTPHRMHPPWMHPPMPLLMQPGWMHPPVILCMRAVTISRLNTDLLRQNPILTIMKNEAFLAVCMWR